MKNIEEQEKKAALLADDLTSLESYIHDLFYFSPLPLSFISPIGVLLEVNPSFEELANLRSYELVGEPIEELFVKKEIEKIAKETFKKGGVRGKEINFFPKGKEKIRVKIYTKERKDERGETVGYFLCIFDMTEIKKLEDKLKEEIKKLKEKLKKRKK